MPVATTTKTMKNAKSAKFMLIRKHRPSVKTARFMLNEKQTSKLEIIFRSEFSNKVARSLKGEDESPYFS